MSRPAPEKETQMTEIRIRLIGNVAFENDMKLSEGFRYDIPMDQMGIPRIPIARLLPASVRCSEV